MVLSRAPVHLLVLLLYLVQVLAQMLAQLQFLKAPEFLDSVVEVWVSCSEEA
jgi:hypothetical protein